MAEKTDFRHIVRIASKDLNGNLPVYRALTKIKGVGIRMAKNIAVVFEKETGITYNSKLGAMPEEMDKKLEDIVLEPVKHGIPIYLVNKRKEVSLPKFFEIDECKDCEGVEDESGPQTVP